jgi:hypothetical protein
LTNTTTGIEIYTSQTKATISIRNVVLNNVLNSGIAVLRQGKVTIEDCLIQGNICDTPIGGMCGVYLSEISNDFLISNVKVVNSTGGFVINRSSGRIQNSLASGNHAKNDVIGGGLTVFNHESKVETRNLDLIGNRAPRGGGLLCFQGNVKMIGGSISNNKAETIGGSGFCFFCKPELENVKVEGNTPQNSNCPGLGNKI